MTPTQDNFIQTIIVMTLQSNLPKDQQTLYNTEYHNVTDIKLLI